MMGSMVAIGLMSGTSLDGIDAALVETDGEGLCRPIAFRSEPYSEQARRTLREAIALALSFDRPRQSPDIETASALITRTHILAVHKLLQDAAITAEKLDLIGFHGQTIAHRPDRGWTWQIGDGAAIADALGVVVVDDFRSADVAAGGQGAPLLPIYHQALIAPEVRPAVVLNLGGVANITFIGEEGELIAFDTGPGNALIDDWMLRQTGLACDEAGAQAAAGHPDETILRAMLAHPYFGAPAPKSLDRHDFTLEPVQELETADGAATLTLFTARAVAQGLGLLPHAPRHIFVAGGGRHNRTLMRFLAAECRLPVEPIEALGSNGDAIEAEGFAYMGARALKGLPISFPGTTGVPLAMSGGCIHRPGSGPKRSS